MGTTLGLVLLLADLGSGRGLSAAELAATAAASPRPAECRRSAKAEDTNPRVWERARLPRLQRYCDALAFGYARLARSPDAALAQAGVAELILPGRAETLVLKARASLATRQPGEAWVLFERARQLSPRSVESLGALVDRGRAALETAHYLEASSVYRALVPRARLLESPALVQRVYIEAAALAMWSGSASLDEALGYLAEARRSSAALGVGELVPFVHALVLSRQGRHDEAAGVLSEASGELSPERLAKSAHAPLLPAGEALALSAVALERRDRNGALGAWREFVSRHPGSPWIEHGRAQVARLSGGRSKAAR